MGYAESDKECSLPECDDPAAGPDTPFCSLEHELLYKARAENNDDYVPLEGL